MISVAVFCVIVVFYFWYGESDTSVKEACIAMLAYIAYTILYLFVPPFPSGTSSQMGQLYGFVPLLSFGAILAKRRLGCHLRPTLPRRLDPLQVVVPGI